MAPSKLSALFVKNANKPGRYADGAGLCLNVTKAGTRSWLLVYRSPVHKVQRGGRLVGREREAGLGPLGTVTLAQAREKAQAFRLKIAGGIDPLDEQTTIEPVRIPTFGELADQYIANHESSWLNSKHVAQWKMTLKEYAAPLRPKPVNEITVEDVLAVLKPLWQTVPETAGRLRGCIEAVLDAAKARKLREGENPAAWKGNLKHLLPKPSKLTRGHHAALPYAKAAEFMSRLRTLDTVAAKALEFTILTASRTTTAIEARWAEFDLETKVWTIPGMDLKTGRRMKTGKAHRVPLCNRSIAILIELKALGEPVHVFPGQGGRSHLSSAGMSSVMRRLGSTDTVHGFRSTFKDWARECTSYPNELSEAALAHIIGDATERAYARGDALERRRELMLAWSAFCEPDRAGNVVPLKRGVL